MESVDRLKAVLYTRKDCHLCEEAYKVLSEFGISANVVDIDGDPGLRERFDTCVPVIEIDGQIRFTGRIDARLLQRIVRRYE
jgi:glutaredoxin